MSRAFLSQLSAVKTCWARTANFIVRRPRQVGSTAGTLALTIGLAGLSFGQISHANRVALSDVDCLVEPSMVVELGAAVPGQLDTVLFDRSDYVTEGMVMAQLESSIEATVVQIAEAVATAETGVELRELTAAFGYRTKQRNQELLASKSISKQNMDQVATDTRIAQLQLKQERENHALAQLELSRAKATLDRRLIRAPISGTITRRYHNPGEFVDSDPVYQIAQLHPLHVEVLLPIAELGTVGVGSRVDIRLDVPGFYDNLFDGVVRRIDSVADAASGTYGIRVELQNPDLTIPSGVRCQADFLGA